ncbi:hypothetical protein WB334_25800, partial [Escherichia coli]
MRTESPRLFRESSRLRARRLPVPDGSSARAGGVRVAEALGDGADGAVAARREHDLGTLGGGLACLADARI